MNARVTTPAERGQDAERSYWWPPVMNDHILSRTAHETHAITAENCFPLAVE